MRIEEGISEAEKSYLRACSKHYIPKNRLRTLLFDGKKSNASFREDYENCYLQRFPRSNPKNKHRPATAKLKISRKIAGRISCNQKSNMLLKND